MISVIAKAAKAAKGLGGVVGFCWGCAKTGERLTLRRWFLRGGGWGGRGRRRRGNWGGRS